MSKAAAKFLGFDPTGRSENIHIWWLSHCRRKKKKTPPKNNNSAPIQTNQLEGFQLKTRKEFRRRLQYGVLSPTTSTLRRTASSSSSHLISNHTLRIPCVTSPGVVCLLRLRPSQRQRQEQGDAPHTACVHHDALAEILFEERGSLLHEARGSGAGLKEEKDEEEGEEEEGGWSDLRIGGVR